MMDCPTKAEATAKAVTSVVQALSVPALLFLFITATAVHAVITAREEEELIVPVARGPGGKLLPITKKKKKTLDREPAKPPPCFSRTARAFFQYASALLCSTFFAGGVAIALHAVWDREHTDDVRDGWWCGNSTVLYIVGSAAIYLYFLLSVMGWTTGPIIVHFLTWVVALAVEIVLLIAFVCRVTNDHCVQEGYKQVTRDNASIWELADIVLASVRVFLLLGMVLLYAAIRRPYWPTGYRKLASHGDETTPLLLDTSSSESPAGYSSVAENGHHNGGANGSIVQAQNKVGDEACNGNGNANGNGNNPTDDVGGPVRDAEAAFYRPDKLPHKSWFEYIRGYGLFFPYMWPKGDYGLQVLVVVCFFLMMGQRVANVLVPIQIGHVVEVLRQDGTMPWGDLALLMVYKLLQGGTGLFGSLRALLWVPVSQHCYRSLTSAAFEHVHDLSLDFHLGKRTGEVLSALNKGGSINTFMEQVTFQVFPMLFDLLFAITYFTNAYGAIHALIVGIIIFYYLTITIRMAASLADQRRDMVNADREEEAVKNDSITSYETVKYFNAEPFEFRRYRNAINVFQTHERQFTYGMNIMNICQSLVFMVGFLCVLMLGAWEVSHDLREIGAFVTLITYLQQLQGPLNFFGTFYRTVQQAMISAERLLELFKIQPTVIDEPGVGSLDDCEGRIRWSGVKFAYDRRKPALQKVDFECKPGTTTAFVGESGGGKSTIFRLMYRYYNCKGGKIEIDGRDVRDLTIDSVRQHIGVVPQDTILFNETLMYNLRYANQDATDEEIYDACRAAHIHSRIMAFPDGYDTKVGERGLRLSGGEKQRVAIARTLLKNPKIIMLDEATSALDSSTEQQIQKELRHVGEGRTLLVIAHRLSTVIHADQILVLHAGRIVERGTHEELLLINKGKYASMWEKQIKAEEAEKEAEMSRVKAKKLLVEAGIAGPDSASEQGSIEDIQDGGETPSGKSTPVPPR